MSTTIKLEPTMKINSFGKSHTELELGSIILRIQNLLYQEVATSPSDVTAGIGIGMYLFDKITDELIGDIRNKISMQIRASLEDVPLDDVIVEQGTGDNVKTLFIAINFSGEIEGKNQVIFKANNDSIGNTLITAFIQNEIFIKF